MELQKYLSDYIYCLVWILLIKLSIEYITIYTNFEIVFVLLRIDELFFIQGSTLKELSTT